MTEEPVETLEATPTEQALDPTAEATVEPTTEQAGEGDSALIGIPETGSGGLVGLRALFGFRVVDTAGNEIGTAQDFVVNTCEANILYFVVDPAEEIANGEGQQLLIPYQATLATPNNGSVDIEQGVFVIDLDATEVSSAPVFDVVTLDMEDPDWDAEVQAYWSSDFELALTAACNVPVSDAADGQSDAQVDTTATPAPDAELTPTATVEAGGDTTGADGSDRQNVYHVVLASQLLEANLQDGNGQLLGMVRDGAIVPETGRTQFIVVEVETDDATNRFVALPPGPVNVLYESADQPVLVLLVETDVLIQAPEFDINNATTDDSWFDYWDQYIPMTLEELP